MTRSLYKGSRRKWVAFAARCLADREKALTTIRIMEGKIGENPDPTPARYTELGNSLHSEDAKLAALTSQLDEIERLLPLPAAGRR